MEKQSSLSFRPFIASTISLFLFGWGIVALTIFTLTPTVWARWLLFFGCMLGLTGLALPLTWFLNIRFPSDPPVASNVIVREAMWVGIYGMFVAWLQQVHLVTVWTGTGLALGLVAIEYLIRMREKAQWKPNRQPEEQPPVGNDPSPDA
jgi:hypothetical protein